MKSYKYNENGVKIEVTANSHEEAFLKLEAEIKKEDFSLE